jgi:hypothetical protein
MFREYDEHAFFTTTAKKKEKQQNRNTGNERRRFKNKKEEGEGLTQDNAPNKNSRKERKRVCAAYQVSLTTTRTLSSAMLLNTAVRRKRLPRSFLRTATAPLHAVKQTNKNTQTREINQVAQRGTP